MFTLMAGINQFERDLISQRTKEGLEAARKRGKFGGKKRKVRYWSEKSIISALSAERTNSKSYLWNV